MTRVYLVRHASPAVRPGTRPSTWHLSDRGIEEARALAEIARGWGLTAIYSSVESKASATAAIIGDPLGLPVRLVEGLEEQRWDAWTENADEFNENVRRILERPEESIAGSEPAAAASQRFDAALHLALPGGGPLAVVSHGRVLTAWLDSVLALESPYDAWRAIPMPGYALVEIGEGHRVRMLSEFDGTEREPA
jgi:broad specificity phosphatase PhoE